MTQPAMPVQGPTLPHSPLTLGQALTATFTIFKRRLGLFAALAFVPSLIIGAMVIIGVLIASVSMIGAFSGTTTRAQNLGGGAIFLFFVILFVVMAAAVVIQIKAGGMLTLLAYETAHDRQTDFNGLREGTKGIVARTLVFMLVVLVASVVLSLLVMLVFGGAIAAIAAGGSRSSAGAFAGLIMGGMLLYFAFIIAAFYFQVRWLYWNQGVAIERLDGFAALGNSWRLTKNNFWRTLGWYLVATLLASAIYWVFAVVFGALSAPLSNSMDGRNGALTAASTVMMVLFSIVVSVLAALLVPMLVIYVTVMYVDQKRRAELPLPGFQAGYPGAPYGASQYGQPQQPYGQPQQPYGQPQQPYGPTTGGYPPAQPYGQPTQPQYGQPGQPQAPYGQQGQPSSGQPGQAPYGQPGQSQPPYGQQPGQPGQPGSWPPPSN